MKKLTILIGAFFIITAVAAQKWKMKEAALMTPWAADVDPENVLPEYPRPIMEREEWLNLNGVWQFQEAIWGGKVPFNETLKEEILVPFPWESAISGVMRQIESYRAWYRRTFEIPSSWKKKKVLLHFGAVDYETFVYVNGRCVGTHIGGFDAFSFDITGFLNPDGNQEIIVGVYDPGSSKAISVGKQNNVKMKEPTGYSYTPASGIWQTVWIEPVAKSYIADLKVIPDIDKEVLEVTAISPDFVANQNIQVKVLDGGKVVSEAAGAINEVVELKIDSPKLWSPSSPFLYDVEITLLKDGKVLDKVQSYTGMRKISLGEGIKGIKVIHLNNQYVFQMGTLDQGYWPDGIFTAPTDEALKWDIETTKKFGYNMIRKHIKVEPQRWYYWCDKLGILVWQDMPSSFKQKTETEKAAFEVELRNMVTTHWNHPSIVKWVVFNEHWGLYDPVRLTEYTMGLDPSRLVIGNSGIDAGRPNIDYEVGHIKDNHSYRPPNVPFANQKRAVVCGEYGAIGYKVKGHIWDVDGPWVHHNYENMEAATAEYEKFIGQLIDFKNEGLSAAVYTQWTDVENEMNGIYTYDRKEIKLDKTRVANANVSTYIGDLPEIDKESLHLPEFYDPE